MPLTFGPAVRLRSRREFTAVQKRGRRVAGRYLTVLGTPNTLGSDRLGIIASRRVGGAVVRNRAKRRLRELFRHRDAGVEAYTGGRSFDLVVIARREVATEPFTAVESEFRRALQRLRKGRA